MFKDKFDLEKYNEVMLDSLNEDGLGMHTVSTGDEIPAHLLETFQIPELASEVKNFEPVLFGLQESLKTINHYKKEAAEFSKERSQLDDEYYRLQVMYEKNKKELNERYLESMKKKLDELGQNGNNNEKN